MSRTIEDLEREKIDQEIKQLRLQTNELSKPWYHKTEFLFLVIPLLFIFGNDVADNIFDSKISKKTEEIEALSEQAKALEVREKAAFRALQKATRETEEAKKAADGLELRVSELAIELTEVASKYDERNAALLVKEDELAEKSDQLEKIQYDLDDLQREAERIGKNLTCDRTKAAFREMTWALFEIGKLYNRFNFGAISTIGSRNGLFNKETESELDSMAMRIDSIRNYVRHSPFVSVDEIPPFANSVFYAAIAEKLQQNFSDVLRGDQSGMTITLLDILEIGEQSILRQGHDEATSLFNKILQDTDFKRNAAGSLNLAPELPNDFYEELGKITSNEIAIDVSILPEATSEFLRFRRAHREVGRAYDEVEQAFRTECLGGF